MAGGFRSIGVSLGLDTTGLQRGFNQASNQLDKFLADARTKLRASGLRGAARLIGPAGALFATYEAIRIAVDHADELQKKQEEIRKTLTETAKQDIGTPLFQKDLENLENFNSHLDETTKRILAMQRDTKSLGEGIVGVISTLVAGTASFVMGASRGVGFLKTLAEGASVDEALRYANEDTPDYEQYEDDLQNQGDSNRDILREQAKKKEAIDRDIAKAQVKADSALSGVGEKEKSPGEQLDDNVRRANELKAKTSSSSNYADTVEGHAQMLADVEELTSLYAKQAELINKIREEEDKRLDTADKLRDVQEKLTVASDKQQGIKQEQAEIEKQLAANLAEQWGNIFFTDEQRLALKEKQLELQNEDNALTERKKELEKELKSIQDEQADIKRRNNQSILESIAPTQAELISGKRGNTNAQAAARKSQEDMQRAQRLYDEYQGYQRIANDPHQTPEARASAAANAARLGQTIQQVYGAAGAASAASGSQEGLRASSSYAEQDRHNKELQQRANDIRTQLNGPGANQPLTEQGMTRVLAPLKTSIDQMSAKLNPKAPTKS